MKGRNVKKILVLVVGALAALALIFSTTGCGSSSGSSVSMKTANSDDSQAAVTALNNAKEIKVKKALINFGGDSWKITADGKDVGQIKGQAFKVIGDTYSLYTPAGNFVGAESEQYRIVNHTAKTFNFNGQQDGAISQELHWPLDVYTFTDAAGKKIGSMDQDFSLTLSGTAKDTTGTAAWSFSKAAFAMSSDITVKRETSNKIPALTAVWAAVIMSEVADAKNSDSGSSSNSSKSHK